MADIRNMLEELDTSELRQVEVVRDNQDRVAEYKLPRREVDILLTGYSTPMRAAVIDRWRVLEAEVVKPPPRAMT
ncbi:hypothetical protein [Pseudomonas umsongensis]|uniref:hypothetical protein n=1 Tax=Pseudomonas umsongensis TaxID=198618 RepID=UPI00200ADCB9|nr:hypothetical protein [Pseudomonas umsongensis]MCK8654897.1 hypothetical protein [Pseudomonas umsongensis]